MTHQPIATAEIFISIAKSASKCRAGLGSDEKDKRLALADIMISALDNAQEALMDESVVGHGVNIVNVPLPVGNPGPVAPPAPGS